MNCNECDSTDSKYKFKCCRKRFCSINCFKSHQCSRDELPSVAESPSLAPSSTPGGCRGDISSQMIPANFSEVKEVDGGQDEDKNYKAQVSEWKSGLTQKQIEVLRSDPKLREYLENTFLRRVLTEIAKSGDPITATSCYINEEYFNDFINHTLDLISDI